MHEPAARMAGVIEASPRASPSSRARSTGSCAPPAGAMVVSAAPDAGFCTAARWSRPSQLGITSSLMYTPSREEFIAAAMRGNLIPVYRELLADGDTPVSAYAETGVSPSAS